MCVTQLAGLWYSNQAVMLTSSASYSANATLMWRDAYDTLLLLLLLLLVMLLLLLLQGIDCPMNAAFMDATVFYGGMPHPKTFKNAICVFERHTGKMCSPHTTHALIWAAARHYPYQISTVVLFNTSL
jgi:hypothetical protein